MKHILVVGASGNVALFLSQWFAKKSRYYRVYTLSRSDKKATIYADINHLTSVQIHKIYEKYEIDAVFHCAALVRPLASDEIHFNAYSFVRFLTKSNIRHILFGSVAEYGYRQRTVSEKTKENPQTLYGLSKLLQKEAASYFRTVENQDIVYLRISNILMPRAQPTSLVEKIFNASEKGISFSINDERISRDFIDIRDIARCIEFILKKRKHTFLYNLTSGKQTSYASLIVVLKKTWDSRQKPFPHYTVQHQSEQYTKGIYDNRKIKTDFKWKPRYSLRKSIKWIVENKYA